jgi:hypothetical protein
MKAKKITLGKVFAAFDDPCGSIKGNMYATGNNRRQLPPMGSLNHGRTKSEKSR